MITTELARMLTRYKAWANEITFSTVAALPEGEATKPRPTLFKNMVHTLNHPYVIDCMFQAHLEGRPHGFTARNTPTHPPLDELWRAVSTLPPRQRAVLVLRYYEDLSEPQIADALGCRLGTVKSQASAALASLRARIDHPTRAGEGL